MRNVQLAVEILASRIATASSATGARVEIAPTVLDRSDTIALRRPGCASANGSARLIRAVDGWIAVNLPRSTDEELVPAWLDGADADWAAIECACASRRTSCLIDDARVLGLAVAAVGERAAPTAGLIAIDPTPPLGGSRRIDVVDLSALWAGPLCAALLAEAGADVIKVEDVRRPDPTPSPFGDRLNGRKRRLTLDLAHADGRAELRARMFAADVVVTSARPRAFAQLGLAPADVLAANPKLLWIAISAFGWSGGHGDRVGFGDDAAAAGGLLAWNEEKPSFIGDALADPLSGLAAAAAALEALNAGAVGLIEIALASVAADVAHGWTDLSMRLAS